MGKDDSWVSSFTHTPINWTGNVGSDDGFNSAQYGWSHPHQHHGSTDMIADFNGDNSSTAGSADQLCTVRIWQSLSPSPKRRC